VLVAFILSREGSERPVAHRLEPGERERRLVPDREEDDRISRGSHLQLEVEQALVEDADVLAGEIREVDRHRHPGLRATLADLHPGACEAVEDPEDIAIREQLAIEGGRLEDREGAREPVRGRVLSRRKELPAVGRHGKGRVVAAVVDEAEERQDARPGVPGAREALAAARRGLRQVFEEARQAVRPVVERVVPGQQVPGFGEEDHHHPHDDANGSPVDLGGIDSDALLLQDLAVRLNEELDRLAHALAQDGREFRLAFPAVEDGLNKG
jgi:hypothetical protein